MYKNHEVNAMFEAIIALVKSCDKRENIHSFNRHLIKHQNECNDLIIVDMLKGFSSCCIASATNTFFTKVMIRADQSVVSVSLEPE